MESESESEEEELSVTSPNFDPLKALYSTNVRLPKPNARVFDNVWKYFSTYHPREDPRKKKDDAGRAALASTSSEAPKRRFLPHQEPVRKPRPSRLNRDVLTRMNDIKGPLSVLRDCMERRVRVKVNTRHMNGLRGYCIAFVAAFDKHWNMALEDVHEVWTRKKKRKATALGESATSCKMWEKVPRPPRVVVVRTEKNHEVCERHVNQLLIRGEQIAFVSVLS